MSPYFKYMLYPIENALSTESPSLHLPSRFASWGSKNGRIDQKSWKKRWGYNTADRTLTDHTPYAVILYQLKGGTRKTMYLTATDLIQREAASGKTWSYKTEMYTTGDIVRIVGTEVYGTGTVWTDAMKGDYFVADIDHTADEEPDASWNIITARTSNTQITLTTAPTVRSNATLAFTSGSEQPSVGDLLTGATSSAEGTVIVVTKATGEWTNGGDAAGTITLQGATGCFNNNENIDIDGGIANVMTVNHADGVVGVDKIVKNGAFVSATTSWTAGNSSTLSSETGGQIGNCLKVLENGADDPQATQNVTVVAGKDYYFNFYHKDIDGTSTDPSWGIYDDSNNAWIVAMTEETAVADAWTQVSKGFTTPSGCTDVQIVLRHQATSADGDAYYFDEATLYNQPYEQDYKIRRPYTVPANHRWSWCIVDDKLVFTNGNTIVQYWDGGTTTYATTMEATPSVAKQAHYCIEYADRLVIADYGVTRDPVKIAWSKNGDPTDFTDLLTLTAGSATLLGTEDYITGLGKVGPRLVVYRRHSIETWGKTGKATAPIFRMSERKGIGCIAPWSIVEANATNYFVGRSDFYMMRGDYPEPIGAKIRDKFFDIVEWTEVERTWGQHYELRNEIEWVANTTEGKLSFVYNYKNVGRDGLGQWSVNEYVGDVVAAGKGAL